MEDIWNGILDLTSRFVIPDWEALVALIPVGLLILIVVWLILLVRKFATAGPTRRGKRRVKPVPPPGIHMPGPTYAPVVAAIGAFLLFAGLVFGGVWLWIGIAGIVLSLLLWGAEGLRDYDHLADGEVEALPEPEHAGPPPGVHMPGPSFRPILAALGVSVLFFGLVFGGWLLVVGVLLTIWTLLGWLIDARREYARAVEADETGHLDSGPEPRWPRRVLWVGTVLVAIALLVDNGIVPPRTDTAAGGEPGAPTEPGASPPAGGGSPAPGPEADVEIIAEGIQFTTRDVSVTGPDFTIAFDNRDADIPHDVDIMADDGATKLFDGDFFPGPEIRVYEVTAIDPGTYTFICSVHPSMTGSITVQ